jgi:hypothetical protein
MACVAVAAVAAINALSPPMSLRTAPPPRPTMAVIGGFGSTIERDFLPTVLRRAHVSAGNRFCDERGCCPASRTTLGTTTDVEVVVATLRSQGYVTGTGDRDTVRAGPFPQVSWTGVLGDGGRRTWRRVDVSRGADVDRPAWPTVYVLSLAACGDR